MIENVLHGNLYNGIATYPNRLFATGFFDNMILNSIGVPIQDNNQRYTLFIRQDIQHQFGELCIFYAVLLGLIIVFVCLSGNGEKKNLQSK
ncbi:hypothetical protein CN680_04030 [Bacillus pseudomycoides]|uniref:Uncharacterized protein n=1 Tax=Bacillus pseudomycoides TaxID=64104 RepID=A0A2B5QZ30_9BACI|nr:hypothetical protein [Bacillus pseudomycoides]PEA81412.1 hypothetical protein CON99_22785 [Bacillus pseudomycoides]PED69012.1 hypothetical protein CON97_27860 [Bacillus pseudomycoides]PEI42073.1 hypothetical protein CN620_10590 [Bacillus pseudomycoides]PEJ81262.1 hypothetical protein CN680_04030 [Bacillus pseudomycoides]PEM15430.1 hypothetical protein CN628_16170 [Bacillus pseudomycoides]